MKNDIFENLKRIHTLTYGSDKTNTITEGLFDFLNKDDEEDDKKADEVSKDVSEFLTTLEDASNSGGLSQETSGSIEYKKSVESMQIGLLMLGYSLPRFGVDGLFGPETASAVKKYTSDNINSEEEKETEGVVTATPEMLNNMVSKLRSKSIDTTDLEKHINSEVDVDGVSDQNFYEQILKNLNAPVTNQNLTFLYAWRQAEGKAGKYNPFNTTQGMPGATKYNSVGVRNYESLEDGLKATIKTLKNGRYNCIIDGLKDDIGASNIAKCESLKVWGTGDLVSRVLRGYENGGKPKVYKLS